MKPLPLRTKLTLFYSIIVGVLLTGFTLLYYRVLSVDLNRALSDELVERSSSLRGYLRFQAGKPAFVYDESDPDEAAFIQAATRYFQVYDAVSGELLAQSPELEAMGVQYSAEDVAQFEQSLPSFADLQTDQRKLRFRNETIKDSSGHPYLLMVGSSTQAVDDAVDAFVRSLAWLIPSGVLLGAAASWLMAGKAWQPIEQSIEQMKQFTASISHELRTPLAVLRGEAEVALMQDSSVEQYRRVLASQLEEFDRLSRMVNQLLTLARAESGDAAIEREEVNVSTLTQSLAEQLEPVAASKRVKLEWKCDPDVTVIGDPGWIERIILNIVDNAIKFTQQQGVVSIRVLSSGKNAVLEVSDNGAGIPADALPHIFERFYRADSSRSNRVEGAGLGLSLVKWAVDQQHGTIEINSEVGKGTCVIVQMPAQH